MTSSRYGIDPTAPGLVTAIDDGTRFNQWGSINVDDEGHPSQKNILIDHINYLNNL